MEDLEPDEPDFYNRFLRIGIANSLREDFLGRCTTAWEKVCYHKGISDPETIEIAIMCSFLVDAPKQGLSIRRSTREHVLKRSRRFTKPPYREPNAKGDILRNSTNVIDQLRFVTEQKVREMRDAFDKGFRGASGFDPMLSELYNNESKLAGGEGPLYEMLYYLRKDFCALYDSWRVAASSRRRGFKNNVSSHYSRFKEIMPPEDLLKDPVISRLVLNADSNLSYWSLLRASAAHYTWHSDRTQVFMWHMAGRELCFIKSQAMGRKSEFGPRTMIEEMYIPLKPSRRYQEIRKTDQDDEEEEEEEEEDAIVSFSLECSFEYKSIDPRYTARIR